jgi:predicted DsbA family dithiol-disulfide isomerase
MPPRLRFVVYSDYLCPWCYNVDVRLQELAERYRGDVVYEYRSYLLRPHYQESRNLEKFRRYTESWLRPAADDDAGTFRVWQSDEGPPTHSIPAHLAAKAAAAVSPEAFEQMHERLLRAYFAENRDISREWVLEALWNELGLPAEGFARAKGDEFLPRVLSEHNEALEFGATGVPAVRLEGNPAIIVGAHPKALYERWIEKGLERLEADSGSGGGPLDA